MVKVEEFCGFSLLAVTAETERRQDGQNFLNLTVVSILAASLVGSLLTTTQLHKIPQGKPPGRPDPLLSATGGDKKGCCLFDPNCQRC
jgi:hypothetical protein